MSPWTGKPVLRNMTPSMKTTSSEKDLFTARTFTVAWYWFLLAAFIAILLRWMPINPSSDWNLNFLRHTHSHVAFLGWVFNGFFAIALQLFIPKSSRKAFFILFMILQAGVVGMAASFPLQGYGGISIAFSTLHMLASACFAWWLWNSPCLEKGTRLWLRMALIFMLLSGLGPLVLGPLAVMDMRDHPAYTLAIYFYLHCQYNGWFIFFLIAAVWQRWKLLGGTMQDSHMRGAALALGIGTLANFSLSLLWLHPPWPVWLIAAGSAIAQIWGAWQLRPLLITAWERLETVLRMVLVLVIGCFVLKLLLQILSCLPMLAPLAHHRFIAIAFLHLVFLGIVTPSLIGWAWKSGWIRTGLFTQAGCFLFLAGSLMTELVLVIAAFAGLGGQVFPFLSEILLAAACIIAAGLILIRPTVA